MIEPLKDSGWVIVNKYNKVWHHGIFDTTEQAEKYLKYFFGGEKYLSMGFSIVRGSAVYSADGETVFD